MRDDSPQGFDAPIHQAIWKPITTFGALRMWSAVWIATCLYLGLVTLSTAGMTWVLFPVVLWFLGQGCLVLLTQWDGKWDSMGIAHLSRRYKKHYHAG